LVKSAHQQLMENHLNSCFKSAIGSNNSQKKKKMTEEILKVTKIFNK
jgi:DNA-binding FrmR family transcriptional regulator